LLKAGSAIRPNFGPRVGPQLERTLQGIIFYAEALLAL
jgi:hypothetical protein